MEYVDIAVPLRSDLEELRRGIRISNFIELGFSPIYIGALIYSVSQIKQSQIVTYSKAMSVGLRNWGKIFGVRFWTGLLIALGLIAFVIPGIIIAVRYALVVCVVVLEGGKSPRAMARSVTLTKGKRGQIFGATSLAWLGILIFTLLVTLLVNIILELAGQQENFVISVLLGCFIKIGFAIPDILMFLYYWEAREKELVDEQVTI